MGKGLQPFPKASQLLPGSAGARTRLCPLVGQRELVAQAFLLNVTFLDRSLEWIPSDFGNYDVLV